MKTKSKHKTLGASPALIRFDIKIRYILLAVLAVASFSCKNSQSSEMEWICLSADGKTLVELSTGKPFLMWGVNYDRDYKMRLLDDYWIEEWDTVVEDFDEMKAMGFNTIRVHLQVGRFMDSPASPNLQALEQLAKLIRLAEERELYLYVTGLACYKRPNIPVWYDLLDEQGRWDVQAEFWKSVAKVCTHSPAVVCYDLMNEPLVPGEQIDDWLTEEGLGDFFYVQNITRTPDGRTSKDIAKSWIDCLVAAIHSVDTRHLVTLGVIPWEMVWPDAKPLFYDPVVSENLDFASVHFYPEANGVEKALRALSVYSIGKPLVVAEMFPMSCSFEEMDQFIEGSRNITQGWISFYWGKTIEEYAQENDFSAAIMKSWLEHYRDKGKEILR